MLELKNICVSFRSERQDKVFGHTRQQVLFDVSLNVKRGTCLGILGESGSGKSTMGRVLCGLLKPDSGEAILDGVSVYASRAGRRNLQNKLSVVFQDYTTSANPRFRVKDIIGEGLTVRERREGGRLERKKEMAALLELVGLPADFAGRFPHELSGGQLQRVCIARAVACKPEVILFDEAISSLDAHTQVQVMDLLRDLKEKLGLTYVFITHGGGIHADGGLHIGTHAVAGAHVVDEHTGVMGGPEADGIVDRGGDAGADGPPGGHEHVRVPAQRGDGHVHALQARSGPHDIAVVKGQHHRVAALGIEQVGEPILGSPVPVAQALGEEALLRGRHVQMVVVGGLVSDCVWHSAYSLLNAGVRQGVFHRRSISSSHLAMFI